MRITLPLFVIVLVLAAFVYPLWGETRGAALFGNAVQILALVVGAINLQRVTGSFAATDAPRRAWAGLQLGISIWVIAQAVELYNEFQHEVTYGGFADVIWLIGYLPLIYGVFRLVNNYRSTGLPLGSRASYVLQCVALLLLYVILFWQTIWDQIADPNRHSAMKVLDFGYPTLDFLLFTAGSVLLRFSWMLRGGLLGRVWLLLCLGFVLMGIGDFALSNLPSLESPMYRMLDSVYFSSYFLIALAAHYQETITHHDARG